MAKRVVTKVGDIFEVRLKSGDRKYFQYIANDLTQLNSDVVRVFATAATGDTPLDINGLIHSPIEFYAHCVVNLGVKMGCWTKVGASSELGSCDVYFRTSEDNGNPKVASSQRWWIWKINQDMVKVGKLVGPQRNAEIGSVIPPDSLVHRIATGEYDFVYPAMA